MEIRSVFPLFPAIRHILSLKVPARPLYKGWRPLYKGLTAPYIRGTAPYIRAGRCQITHPTCCLSKDLSGNHHHFGGIRIVRCGILRTPSHRCRDYEFYNGASGVQGIPRHRGKDCEVQQLRNPAQKFADVVVRTPAHTRGAQARLPVPVLKRQLRSPVQGSFDGC